ncbi:MAG: class I SAM-dependent rRNA methyltransferase [Magnetospirillum sp. WYHS-4]
MTNLSRLFLNAGADRRLRHGHPWAYSNEIRMDAAAKALPAGSLARLCRVDGKPLGVGTFNPHVLIAFRMLSENADAAIDEGFLAGRLRRALALRERLYDEPFYRLVHAESDGLPGLIVDRFGDVAVLQVNTAGMEALSPSLLAAVDAVLKPRAVVLRNDTPARQAEGLEAYVKVAKGDVAGPVELRENGLVFFADPVAGQKTGWFFDQRDNRAFVAPLAKGRRMLDVYSYGGGFGIAAAAAGATEAVIVDSSEGALDLVRRAAQANGVAGRCKPVRGDAYRELERLAAAGERFGVVACDPPAFVKSRKDLKAGLKGYRKLAGLAAPLIEPGGFLFLASCSHNVAPAELLDEAAAGIGRAGRSGRLIRQAGAAPDHPVHPHLPETAYLKALVFQLD